MNAISARNHRKKYAKKKYNRVIAEDVYALNKIFERNAWTTYPGYVAILNAHAELMQKMNDSQKDLYLELTNRFLWIRDYTNDIAEQFNRIFTQFKNIKTFYAIRCTPLKDQKWSKSAGIVLYEIKNPEVSKQLVKPIKILDRIEDLKLIKEFNHSLFVLVDDFVGTGDTATKCINDMIKANALVTGKLVVLCIAVLERGISRLSSLKVPVFAGHILKRGIRDYYSGYNQQKYVQLMTDIEAAYNIKDFNFGYGGSEALICLKRCPNNTFPIYWHGKKSPYSRY